MQITEDKNNFESGIFKNQTLMFTGKLTGISRAEAKSLVEKNSGKIVSNVSNKLDFLVVGEKPTMRKVNEAKNLNIKVLSPDKFIEMISVKDS